ncbi:MAG: hypothetical protein ACRCXT_00460 [Paraclostridium sp.]
MDYHTDVVELGFSEDFLKNYSPSSSKTIDSKGGVPHIWVILNHKKLLTALERVMYECNISQKQLYAGSLDVKPVISRDIRNDINLTFHVNNDTGEQSYGMYITYVKDDKATKKHYMNHRKTQVSIYELLFINNPSNFQIDTKALLVNDEKAKSVQDKTLSYIKDMAQDGSGVSFSFLSILKNNIQLATMINSYRDMYFLPVGDIFISQDVSIPLSEYFTPMSTSKQDMLEEYKKLCYNNINVVNYVDTVIVR